MMLLPVLLTTLAAAGYLPTPRGLLRHDAPPLSARLRPLRMCDASAANEEEDSASAEEAVRVLGLGPDDADLIGYLRDGRTLLSRRVSIVLPSDCDVLSESLLLTAEKLCKLGATVEVLTDRSVDGAEKVPWTAKVPYPRCVARPVNLTSIGELAGALQRVSAVVLCGDSLPDGAIEAFAAALPLAGVGSSSEASGDAAGTAGAAAGADGAAAESEGGASASGGVQQMVLLSSMRAYGRTLEAGGVEGALSEEAAMEAALALAAAKVAAGADAESAADDADEESDELAAVLQAEEAQLRRASTARLAVLRACPLFSEEGAAASEVESLVGDAIGLQELLADYLDDLDGLSLRGLPKAPTPKVAALLPPASTPIQLTHSTDLAGATVYAILGELEGAYHVCSAPLTMQQLFDGLSRRKEWERVRLPDESGHGETAASGLDDVPAYFATSKLEAAGYRMMRPRLEEEEESDSDPQGDEQQGIVRPTGRAADPPAAGAGGAGPASETGADEAPE